MFVRFLLLFLLCQATGDLVYKCNNAENGQDSLKLVPAADGVLGRYTAELCTLRNPNATEWGVDLWYYIGIEDCEELLKPQPTHLYSHSRRYENLRGIGNFSCSNICYSMNFDLIFAGCYSISGELSTGCIPYLTTLQDISNKVTIENNLTLTQVEHSQQQVKYSQNDEYVTLRWILGVPIAQPFTMKLWRHEPTDPNDEFVTLRWITGVPIAEPFTINLNKQKYKLITESCTLSESAYEVFCKFAVSEGCYRAVLEHKPLWAHSAVMRDNFLLFKHYFCKTSG